MSSTETTILNRLDTLTHGFANLARLMGARLTRQEVLVRLDIHRNTLPKMISAGFPQPTRDGKWLLADVIEWEALGLRAAAAAPAELEPPTVGLSDEAHHLYRHFDKDGALLYVGVSLRAINRLSEHKETAGWYWSIARVEVTGYASREHALIAERNAIRREKPQHNIIHAGRSC